MYLDRNARELVLRFAYAGQPLSGKTRSIRALLPLLKGAAVDSAIHSPHEAQGRTLYFDWASYRGGSVRGNTVRCQIVTVPGQETLARRRQLLVESADVVIFVVDSDPLQLAEGRRSYQEILPWLAREGRRTIPVIFQCNKRDLPSAVPLDRIREQLGLASGAHLFESTATSGRGIRLAFIAALRAACAQAGELRALQQPNPATLVDDGEQLLELIERIEAGATAVATPRAVPAPRSVATAHPSVPPPRVEDTPSPAAPEPATRIIEAQPVTALPRTATEVPVRGAEAASPVATVPAPISTLIELPPLALESASPPAQEPEAPRSVPPPRTATELAARLNDAPGEVAATPTPAREPSLAPLAEPVQRSTTSLEALRRDPPKQPRQQPAMRWSGQGPRPAVMPAVDWHAFVRAHGQTAPVRSPASRPAEPPVSAVPVPAVPVAAVPATAAPATSAPVEKRSSATPLPSKPSVQPPTFASGSARPAVMPMAAWQAWLQANQSSMPTPTATRAETPEVTLDSEPAAPIHDEVDSVLLPLAEQPLSNVWPVAAWQALSSQFHRPARQAACQDGIWTGEIAPGWLASSAALFGDRDTGLEALGLEVQRRERLRAHLWPHRCLVLCGDGPGYWRLWELVRIATTLDQILRRILIQSMPGRAEQTAGHLVMLGRAYLKTLDAMPQTSEQLTMDFGNIAQHEGRLVYTGWLHAPLSETLPRREDPLACLATQLRLHLPAEMPPTLEVLEICRELQRTESDSAHVPIAELFSRMLMRYADAPQGRESSAGARH